MISAAVGGVAGWSINKYEARRPSGEIYYTPSGDTAASRVRDTMPKAGNHFTSYQADQYPDLTYAAENAVKAVVNIESIREVEYGGRSYNPFFDFFGMPYGYGGEPQTREQRAGGSGVIISTDGYIVTNNHVVEDATKLKVKLNDGRLFDAELVGTDPTTDVALIKIDGKDLPTIPFGNSDELRLGEWVLAIGSPFDLQSTITAGIVSAKARDLGVIPNEARIESFIQTDAAVNPGNSGGALVNTRGELVGINTVIKSSTGSYVGYSFAVPETIVRKVVVDLKEYGVVQRAMLGVSYRPIDQAFIEQMGEETGIKTPGGLYVASVEEGSAASEAGIRKGDIIVAIDGTKTDDSSTMMEKMAQHRPNDKVKITLMRDGNKKEVEAVLKNKVGKNEMMTREMVDVAPTTKEEYFAMLHWSMTQREHPVAIRVPACGVLSDGKAVTKDFGKLNTYEVTQAGSDVAFIGLGSFYPLAQQAAAEYEKRTGVRPTVINPYYITGLDKELLAQLGKTHKTVVTLEDGVLDGGFGQKIAAYYGGTDTKVLCYGLQKEFLDRYDVQSVLEENRLTSAQISDDLQNL